VGEGDEVVVGRIPANGWYILRVRDLVALPGDLGDEGSGFFCGGVPAELGSVEDRGQFGQEQGTGGDSSFRWPYPNTTKWGGADDRQ
jgi:hypothetical protein